MKTFFFTFIALFIWLKLYPQDLKAVRPNKNKLYDNFGRVIKNETGEKIFYTFSETIALNDKQNVAKHEVSGLQYNINSKYNGEIYCQPAWQYAIMGTCIGRRSLNVIDLDNDGSIEIVCSAQPGNFYGGYSGFWYILKYDAINQEYKHAWVSDLFQSYISRIAISDINSDGIIEIFVGFESGEVLIYNPITKVVIGQISVPSGNKINDIQIGDADNDGIIEIAISDENNIYFYNKTTFALKSQIPFGCNDFKIGNVDGDAPLEIVNSMGKVIDYNGTSATISWTFDGNISNDNYYLVELSDIDSDGMKEIIRAKSWDYIDVYDANTQSLKYEIETDLDIHALLLKDVNNDNIDEIIYGDGQWGSIYCINSTTQAEIWHIDNPGHGITAISIADVNNDSTLEVMWGAGWTSTGADYFYVADIETHSIEWTSVAIDGPFYAIEISDIDNDGIEEIVAISYESESGYGSGIISVFNSETYELEWQSDGDFLYSVWTGIFDFKISDIDNDGIKEIIVAAGETYDGKIWIIDGITKAIESSHEFYAEDIDEFYALSVIDIDNDGQIEIIAGNESKVYIINPTDYSVEWSSASLSGYYQPSNIVTGNIDNDTDTEIIICKGYLHTIDGISHQQWQSIESNYSILDIYDFNNDNKYEIVAGTANGYITTIDGTSHQLISSIKVSNYQIDGLKVADLNADSIPEFIFTSNGIVCFYSDSNLILNTQKYAPITGKYNGLKLADIDSDGKMEVFVGTTNKIIEINSNCYNCLWFKSTPVINMVSCGGVNDGSIILHTSGGEKPYNYLWNTGASDSALFSLSANTYIVTISDNTGCEITDTIILNQAQLITNHASTNVSCNHNNNGSATVFITEGSPPYSFLWNTGATSTSINNLSAGVYTVTVNDSKNCSSTETIMVEKDTMIMNAYKTDIKCYGYNNGNIATYIYEGNPPYTYQWSNGATSSSIYNLHSGDYTVTAYDFSGCSAKQTITINEPQKILTQITTTIDDPSTGFGEGTATINVMGGIPPYSVYWNDPFLQTGITALNLKYGKYIAIVIDSNNCQKLDTAIIDTVQVGNEALNFVNLKIFPNPTNGILNIEIIEKGNYNIEIEIHDYLGRLAFSNKYLNVNKTISINLSNFNNGFYCVSTTILNKKLKYYIEIIK